MRKLISICGLICLLCMVADNIDSFAQDRSGNLYYADDSSEYTYLPTARPLINIFEDGNADQRFWSIIQDKRGIMYFGNHNYGIQQFDGENWNLIAPPNNSTVFSMAINEEGTIFAGARADFGYLTPDSLDQLQFQSLLSYVPDSLQIFDRVYVEITGDAVFFCTNPYLFRWEGGVMTTWENPGFAGCGVSGNTLYINDQNQRLLALVDDTFQPISPHLKNMRLNSVLELQGAVLFITTQSIFAKDGDELRPLSRFSEIRGNIYIHDAVLLRDENIAFATNNGIYIYTPEGRLVYHLTKSEGLTSNNINRLYVDEGGNLWASTNQNINFIEYNSPLRLFFNAQEHSAEIISAYEHNGQIVLGTDEGLFIWKEQEWKQQLSGTSIWDVGHIGNALLIGAQNGLFVYQDGNFKKLNDSSVRVITVSERYEKLAYVYYVNRAVEVLKQNTDGTFTSNPLVEFSEPIYTLIEDKQGDLWRGTGNWGIYRDRLQENGDIPELVETLHYTQKDGLPAPSFNYTTKIGGEVGFITEEGLYRFDIEQQKIVRDLRFVEAYSPEQSRRTWPTIEDKLGHVWMDFGGARVFENIPDENGDYQISRGPYGRIDVLGNINQFLTLDENTVLFATYTQAFLFNRSLQEAPRYPFNTLVRSITLGNDSLLWGGYGPAEITLKNEIHFTRQAVRFNWSATTYYPSINPLYRYRLTGLDESWSNWTDETYRDFTNLSEGNYTFEVQSRNIYDVMGQTASVNFTILPPWYRSWWAYSLYAVFGLMGLVFTVHRLVKWRIHQQMIEMKAQQAEELKKLDVIKSQFFSNVSHELRTPLTLTIGPLEELKKPENGLEESSLSKVSLALRNAKRLLTLVTEILDISRLEASENKLKVTNNDLASFIRMTAQNFNSLANQNNIEYSIKTPQRLTAWFNQDQINKVLTNLLSNAFKFTPDGKEISLILNSNSEQATIEIRDSGMGIPQEDLPFIFDRFYQSKNSNSRLQSGTGIGLALVKHLVELHGGSINVASTLSKGTTFIFTLPLNAQTLPHAEIEESPDHSFIPDVNAITVDGMEISKLENSSRLDEEDHTTILVVEDNMELRQFITDQLRHDYRVLEAINGKEGLEKTISHLPDIVISDVMMPEMNGFEMVEQLRKNSSINFIPVILLTGKDTKEDTLKGLDLGANDYIVKPFDMDELKARVKSTLRSQKLLKTHFETDTSIIKVDKSRLKSADQKFIEQVQEAILANLEDSSLSVEKLADIVNVGRTTLHRKLTNIAGETPVQLIRKVRLEQAKKMIENHTGTISEIAYSVGFESISWFSKCFKERYKKSPSDFLS